LPLVAIDTNIFAYAAGLKRVPGDEAKIAVAVALLSRLLNEAEIVVAAQVFAELHFVLMRRQGLSSAETARKVGQYMAVSSCIPTTDEILATAFELSSRHNLQTYDAIILSAAAASRCDVLYSEDMQAGFTWRGVEVVNPFAA
jgi:predicted nucleic acid-binding protein